MPQVNFVAHNGKVRTVAAKSGTSVMKTAVEHEVPGIVADCGGSMSCATCHVYIPDDWLGKVGPASGDEAEMLELALDPAENSRLSCQIIISDDLDGLIIQVPKSQF